MADSIKITKQWLDNFYADDFNDYSDEDIAYILYGMVRFGLYGEKTNLVKMFNLPPERNLNYALAQYYPQINNMINYEEKQKKLQEVNKKYNDDAIYFLRKRGYTGKEICNILHYECGEKNLSTTKGWKKELEERKNGQVRLPKADDDAIKCLGVSVTDKNTDSVQISVNEDVTDKIQICTDTDTIQTDNTESVQKSVESVKNGDPAFNF